MMTKLFFFFLCMLCLLTGYAEEANPNLVRNPQFDVVWSSGLPANWGPGTPGVATRVVNPDGGYCLELKAVEGGDTSRILATQTLDRLVPGKQYVFSIRIKGSGGQFRTYVGFQGANGMRSDSGAHTTAWRSVPANWTTHEFSFVYPANMTAATLVLWIQGDQGVLFDDASITAAPEYPAQVWRDLWAPGSLVEDGLWAFGRGAELSTDAVHQGTHCLKLVSNAAGENTSASISGIPTELGKRYRLTYFVRSGGGSGEGTGYQYFRVYTSWVATDSGRIPQQDGVQWIDTFSHYQQKTLEFTAPDKPNGGMTITCQVQGPGSVYLDSFKLEAINENIRVPKVTLQVDSPYYRDASFASARVDQVAGTLRQLVPEAVSGSVTLTAAGSAAQENPAAFTDGALPFQFQADSLAQGSYTLSAKAYNAAGQEIDREERTIRILPPAAVEVVAGRDHIFRINGQPFLPIHMWDMPGAGLGMVESGTLAAIRQAGYNLINLNQFYEPDFRSKLDLCWQFGVRVIGIVDAKAPTDPAELALWKDKQRLVLSRYMDHPALFGYFLSDEPLWCGRPLAMLMEAYNTYREIDSGRPVWINEAPRNEIAELSKYAAACDIYGVDIYPIPPEVGHSHLEDKTMTCVGKYTLRMRESVGDRKPIWLALQGFAWGDIRNTTPAIYPTLEQTRFMAYDAFVRGQTGLSYWGMQFNKETAIYDSLFAIGREIHQLSAVIAAPTVTDSAVRYSAPSLVGLHKRHAGGETLIVVNEAPWTTRADIAVPGWSGPVKVVFENRSLELESGGIHDSFPPYGVHIYTTAAELPAPLTPIPSSMPTLTRAVPEYLAAAARLKQSRRYSGTASWIWHPGKSTVAGSQCHLRKSFTLSTSVRNAKLIATADNSFRIWINGAECKVPFASDWTQKTEIDVASLLKPGNNTIAVAARDAGSAPCGFLLDLNLELTDGKTMSILSDGSWRSSENAPDQWLQAGFDDGNWTAAEIVAPFGQGAWARFFTIRPE